MNIKKCAVVMSIGISFGLVLWVWNWACSGEVITTPIIVNGIIVDFIDRIFDPLAYGILFTLAYVSFSLRGFSTANLGSLQGEVFTALFMMPAVLGIGGTLCAGWHCGGTIALYGYCAASVTAFILAPIFAFTKNMFRLGSN